MQKRLFTALRVTISAIVVILSIAKNLYLLGRFALIQQIRAFVASILDRTVCGNHCHKLPH